MKNLNDAKFLSCLRINSVRADLLSQSDDDDDENNRFYFEPILSILLRIQKKSIFKKIETKRFWNSHEALTNWKYGQFRNSSLESNEKNKNCGKY